MRALGHLGGLEKSLGVAAADQVGRDAAQQPLARRVYGLECALAVEHKDRIGRVVDDDAAHLVDFIELALCRNDGALGGVLGAEVAEQAEILGLPFDVHGRG